MFALKRASYVQDELLADVDERFIQEVQRNKGNINKYKGEADCDSFEVCDKYDELPLPRTVCS